MNLANQRTVVQSANQVVITIRQAELQYFSSFFSTFGVQSMVLAGVLCGAVSQTPGLDAPSKCNYFWILLYNVSTAASIIATIHVLLCSVFLNVYGQGIALRGPLGSMVKAVNGMIVEQMQVVAFFLLGILSFAIQVIGIFWIVMDQTYAIVCSIIILIGISVTYSYTLRIYNRFHWVGSTDHWNTKAQHQDDGENDLDPTEMVIAAQQALNTKKNKSNVVKPPPIHKESHYDSSDGFFFGLYKSSSSARTVSATASTSPLYIPPTTSTSTSDIINVDILSQVTSATSRGHPAASSSFGTSFTTVAPGGSSSGTGGAADPSPSSYLAGAYLTLNTDESRDRWVRYYFVLRDRSMVYYKDKRTFDESPAGSAINKRPADLTGYRLLAGSDKAHYLITLVPTQELSEDRRKVWKLRCDTRAEFDDWIEKFSFVLNESSESDNDEFISTGVGPVLATITESDERESTVF